MKHTFNSKIIFGVSLMVVGVFLNACTSQKNESFYAPTKSECPCSMKKNDGSQGSVVQAQHDSALAQSTPSLEPRGVPVKPQGSQKPCVKKEWASKNWKKEVSPSSVKEKPSIKVTSVDEVVLPIVPQKPVVEKLLADPALVPAVEAVSVEEEVVPVLPVPLDEDVVEEIIVIEEDVPQTPTIVDEIVKEPVVEPVVEPASDVDAQKNQLQNEIDTLKAEQDRLVLEKTEVLARIEETKKYDEVKDWIAPEGSTLRGLLTEWGDLSGWRVVWNMDRDYTLEAGAVFRGRFVDVSAALLRSFARARPAPKGVFYKGNKVLVISTREDENAE